MKIDIKVPEVGESVQEAVLAQWYRRDGDMVKKDDILFLIETDKVTLEVAAEADGILKIVVPEGATIAIGTVVGTLDSDAAAAGLEIPVSAREEKKAATEAPRMERLEETYKTYETHKTYNTHETHETGGSESAEDASLQTDLSPSVRRLIAEKKLDASKITGTGPGGRITRGDVLLYLEESATAPKAVSVAQAPASKATEAPPAPDRIRSEEAVTRKPMSRIRQRIAERLLYARQNTAMLTTFNEIDMSRVQAIRARFKEAFHEKYGIPLGMMSFFIKASVAALKEIPEVNASIEDKDIVYHHYYHVCVAIGAERGLVAPVIRNADQLSFAGLERAIADYVVKIRENRLEISDLEGGTFTVSNGGIYGSLLSTPILNTPQSGILGMHKIEDRPVAIDGQVAIRPMMYVALSYDHRIVDGREAVTFLKRIKECIENPERMMIEI